MNDARFEENPDKSKEQNKPSASGSPSSKAKDKKKYVSPEIESMLDRMRQMREDLEQKMATVYEKGKEQNIDVDSYLGRLSSTMPKEHLEKFRQQQANLQNKIKDVIPSGSCLKKHSKSLEKMTQERKAKTLGARKKWIPMR